MKTPSLLQIQTEIEDFFGISTGCLFDKNRKMHVVAGRKLFAVLARDYAYVNIDILEFIQVWNINTFNEWHREGRAALGKERFAKAYSFIKTRVEVDPIAAFESKLEETIKALEVTLEQLKNIKIGA